MKSQFNFLLLITICSMAFFVDCLSDIKSTNSIDCTRNNSSSLLKREITLSGQKRYTTLTNVETITSFATAITTKVIETTNISEVPEVKSTSIEYTVTSFSAHRTVHKVVVYKTHYKTKPTSQTSTSTITNINVQTNTETNILTTVVTYTENSIYVFTVTLPYTRTKYSRSRWISTSKTSSTIYQFKPTTYAIARRTIMTALESTKIEYDTQVIEGKENEEKEILTTIIPTKTIVEPYTTVESVLDVYTTGIANWPQVIESWSITRITHSSAYYVTGQTEYEDGSYTLVTLSSLSEYRDIKTNINTFISYDTSYFVSTGENVETLLSSRTVKTTETVTRTIESVTKTPQTFTTWIPHTEIKSLTSIEEITIPTILIKTVYVVEEIATLLEISSSGSEISSLLDMSSTSKEPTLLPTLYSSQENSDLEKVNSTTSSVKSSLSNTIVISDDSLTTKTKYNTSNHSYISYTSNNQTHKNTQDPATLNGNNTSTSTNLPTFSYSKSIMTFTSRYQTLSNISTEPTRTLPTKLDTSTPHYDSMSISSSNGMSLETTAQNNYTDIHVTTNGGTGSKFYSTIKITSLSTKSDARASSTSSEQPSYDNKTFSVTKRSSSPTNYENSSIFVPIESSHNSSYNSESSYTKSVVYSSDKTSVNVSTASQLSKSMSLGPTVTPSTITSSLYVPSVSSLNGSISIFTTHDTDQLPSSNTLESVYSSVVSESKNNKNTTGTLISSNSSGSLISLTNSNMNSYTYQTSTNTTKGEVSSISLLKTSKHLNITFSSTSVLSSSWSSIVTAMSSLDALIRTKNSSLHITLSSITTGNNISLNNSNSKTTFLSRHTGTTNSIIQPVTTSNAANVLSKTIQEKTSTYNGISHLSSHKSTPTDISTSKSSSLISTASDPVKTSIILSSSTADLESTSKSSVFHSSLLTNGVSSKTEVAVSKQSPIQNSTSSMISFTTLGSKSSSSLRKNVTHSYWTTTTRSVSENIDLNTLTDEEEEEELISEYTSSTTIQFTTYSITDSNISISESSFGISNIQSTKSVTHLNNITSTMLITTDSTLSPLASTKRDSSKFSLTFVTSVPLSQDPGASSLINDIKPNPSIPQTNTHKSKTTESVIWNSSYSTVQATVNTLSKLSNVSKSINPSSSILATHQIPSSFTNTHIPPDQTSHSMKYPTSSRSMIIMVTTSHYYPHRSTVKNSNKSKTKSQILTALTNAETSIFTILSDLSKSFSTELSISELEKTISNNLFTSFGSEIKNPSRTKTEVVEQIPITDEYPRSTNELINSSKQEKPKNKTSKNDENIEVSDHHMFKSSTVMSSPERSSVKISDNVDMPSERTEHSNTETDTFIATETGQTNSNYNKKSKDEYKQSSTLVQSFLITNSEEISNGITKPIPSDENNQNLSIGQVLSEAKATNNIIFTESNPVEFSSSTLIIVSRNSLDALQKSARYKPTPSLDYKTLDGELWQPATTEGLQYYNIAVSTDIRGTFKVLFSLLIFLMLI